MRIGARVFQAALTSYGFVGPNDEPLILDGVIGPATQYAAARFDEWVETREGGDLWGDYSIIPDADGRNVEITPDDVARRFQTRGSSYLAEHPDAVVFPRERRSSSAAVAEAPTTAVALSLPFWRTGNPWAWVLSFFGLLGVGWGSYTVSRRLRRTR